MGIRCPDDWKALMPRTIDHVVVCHQHAISLRVAEKPICSHTINLHRILAKATGQQTAEQVAVVARQIAAEIWRLPNKFFDQSDAACDYDFLNIVEELEAMTAQSLIQNFKRSDDEPADVLDGWLQEIYDWCDINRVWIRG